MSCRETHTFTSAFRLTRFEESQELADGIGPPANSVIQVYCPGQTFASSFWKLSQLLTGPLRGAPK